MSIPRLVFNEGYVYDQLAVRTPSPIVDLNRAVAISFAEDPAAGLAIADELAKLPALAGCHLVPAVQDPTQ